MNMVLHQMGYFLNVVLSPDIKYQESSPSDQQIVCSNLLVRGSIPKREEIDIFR